MADLPDLDPNNIGLVAYYDAFGDGGATEIDPSSALSASNVYDYDLYDNGVDGRMIVSYLGRDSSSLQTGHFHFRIKTDGYVVIYNPHTTVGDDIWQIGPTKNTEPNPIQGPYTFATLDQKRDIYQEDVRNMAKLAIEQLVNELDTSSIVFNLSDISFYDYEYNADGILFGGYKYVSSQRSESFGVGSNTTVHDAWLMSGDYGKFELIKSNGGSTTYDDRESGGKERQAYKLSELVEFPGPGETIDIKVFDNVSAGIVVRFS